MSSFVNVYFYKYPFRIKRRLFHSTSLSLLLAFLAMPIYGQNIKNGIVKTQAPILKEIVVTSASTTSTVMVATNPKIPRQPLPASDGADYLKTIPGFSTIRNGGTNADPVFRGMFGSRLNIVNDGGVILGACPNRMDNPTSYISPESYDRLVVIKGPQTVKWGPVGSAATILFERDPQHFNKKTIKGSINSVFGSNHRFESRLDGVVGDKLGYVRLIANKAFSHDYRDGNHNIVPSAWNKWNGDLFLGWTPDKNTLLELSGGLGDGEARYAGRGMDGSQFKRRSMGAKFTQTDINDNLLKLEAQIYYNYADHIMDNFRLRSLNINSKSMMGEKKMEMSNDRPANSLNPHNTSSLMNPMGMNMANMPMEMRVDRSTFGGRLMTRWQWKDFIFDIGLDAQQNTHRTRKRVNMLSVSGWDRDAVFYNYGVFAETTWNITTLKRLISGMRVDKFYVEDFRKNSKTLGKKRNNILPSMFLRYEQDLEDLPITNYIGIGHAERFPDYWELMTPKSAEGAINAFAAIKPEKTTQIDFGSQYSTDKTNIWFSGYLGHIQDYILFDYSSQISKASNINATIIGGELGFNQNFFDNWQFEASAAYAWGRNKSDKEALPQIPPLEARLSLTYSQESWSFGALWRLVAKQTRIAFNKGNVVGYDYSKSAAFGVLSLNGTYKFNNKISLAAGVDNLLNKNFYEHLNKDGDAGFGFPSHYQVREPGRTLWARIDFKF